MLTTDDLKEHFRHDPELPQGWDAVRPVMIQGWGDWRIIVEYHNGEPWAAVACVHAYLDNIDRLYGDN